MLKLAVIQTCPVFGNKSRNIKEINDYIYSIDADILCFTELALSGYYFLGRDEAMDSSEPFNGKIISEFASKAESLKKIIIIGFAERLGDKCFNSAALLFPDPKLNTVYRKTHLFYRERFCFDEGDTGFFVIKYKEMDLNIGAMICYDWRFPESARTLGRKGADLIVCPSNLVTDVWQISMPSRALENKVYLAVANRYGIESRENDTLLFKGKSAIYGYNGEIIQGAASEGNSVLIAEIEPEKTRDKSFNPYNDIFKDLRTDMYN